MYDHSRVVVISDTDIGTIYKQARDEIIVLENRRNRYETAIAGQRTVSSGKLDESPSTPWVVITMVFNNKNKQPASLPTILSTSVKSKSGSQSSTLTARPHHCRVVCASVFTKVLILLYLPWIPLSSLLSTWSDDTISHHSYRRLRARRLYDFSCNIVARKAPRTHLDFVYQQ